MIESKKLINMIMINVMRNNMVGYKQIIHILRVLIHFIVCIQLVLYPAWSFSDDNPSSSKSSDSASLNDNHLESELQKAQQFNEEVVSLYDHILGRRETSEYYRNHPLDVYGLIGQEVKPYQYKELDDKSRDKVAFSTTESDYQRRQMQYAHTYPLWEERIAERLFGKKEEASQPEDTSATQEEVEAKAKAEAEKAKAEALKKPFAPYRQNIPIEHVFVEVVDEKGEVRAILNTHGEKVNPLVFSDASNFGWVDRSLYKNHSYIMEGEGKYQFRLSYRGQVLHTFPNHINWISMLGPYVVFMQPSQVYEKGMAMPSFIDLQFFQPALGKTELPLFRIPAQVDTEEKRSTLLAPGYILRENVSVTDKKGGQESALKVVQGNRPYTLTQSELAVLSSVQQMFYNVTVSLINIKNYDTDVIPFVTDIAKKMEQLTEGVANSEGKDYTESVNILRDILSARLQQRSTIGSPNDRTGAYGQWVSAQDRLNRNQARLDSSAQDTRETQIENLEKDAEFQKAVSLTSAEHAKREGVLRRLQALYWRLTMPQPLGAPKLLQGLGFVAGSLRPGKTVSDQGEELIEDLERVNPSRRQKLTEGLKQVFASGKGRVVSSALVAGLLGMASPEVAQFYHEVFSFSKEWVRVAVLDTVVQPVNSVASAVPAVPDYFSPDKRWRTADAFGFGVGVLLLLFGAAHIAMNSIDLMKYLKSRKAQAHQDEVKSFRQRFVDWEQKIINDTNEGLIRSELRKIGLPVELHLPGSRVLKMVFKTENPWARLIDNYSKRNNNVELHFHINNGAEVISLLSSQEVLESTVEDRQKMELILKPSANPRARGRSRTFVLQEGNFADLFKDVEGLEFADKIEIELSAKNRRGEFVFNNYRADIEDVNFSEEQNQRVKQALADAYAAKQNRSLLRRALRRIRKSEQEQATAVAQIKTPSQTQINSFAKAVFSSFSSFGNWYTTYFYLIKEWNEWFKFRTLLLARPSVNLRAWFFNKYFDRIHHERHVATVLNGGMTSPLRVYRDRQQEKKSGKEYLSALEDFERQIVAIEKQYIRASAEEAHLFALEMYMDPKISESVRKELERILQSGVAQESSFNEDYLKSIGLKVNENKGNFSLNLKKGKTWDRANRQAVFLMELFQRTLRKEAIRDLLREKLGVSDQNLSDWQIREMVMERAQKGESLDFFSEEEDLEQVRERIRTVSDRLNLKETIVKSVGKFYRDFSNKWKTYSELRGERKINPFKNLSIGRYEVGSQTLEQPEALTRTVKAEIVRMFVDKIIELGSLFVIFAAVDHGIAQMIHETRFSEEAWFHGSRFVIWNLFVATAVFELLGAAWLKAQFDARLAAQGGFERVPTKKDVEKRFAGFKWYHLEGFRRPFQNKIGFNNKFAWLLAISNFKAAIPTLVLIDLATLGRVDVELFWGGYLAIVLGISAFRMKLENTFEMSKNYSARGLIRADLDLAGKDKKLLSHIDVVRYMLRESFKDRIKFNIAANFILNPLGYLFAIAQTVDTSWGSRGLTRVFGMGNSLTEYWVGLMNVVEEKGLMSRGVANACKKVFTRNRTDIID